MKADSEAKERYITSEKQDNRCVGGDKTHRLKVVLPLISIITFITC